MAKIIAHELLDRQDGLRSLVAVQLGQADLLVAIEHVVRLAGVKVQLVADAEQELGRLAERVLIGFRSAPKSCSAAGSVAPCRAKPSQRSNCRSRRQPLERLMFGSSRYTVSPYCNRSLRRALSMALNRLFERARVCRVKRSVNTLNSLALPAKQPRFHQRSTDGRILQRHLAGLPGRAQALAELQPGVGHVALQPAGQRKHGLVGAGGVEDHQVDVGIGRHVAAAVTAVRHQRHLRAELLRSFGPQVGQRPFEQFEHDRIEQLGQAAQNLDARRAGLVLLANLLAAFLLSRACLEHGRSKAGGDSHRWQLQWRSRGRRVRAQSALRRGAGRRLHILGQEMDCMLD